MRTDLQINYYALELVYDKLGIYKTALESMDDALANLKTFLEQQESEAVSKILEKIEEVTISTGKKQDMITDMQFVLNGYITEMTKLVNANTPGVMTRVDPPDIKYNLDQIKSARDALQKKVNESVPTYYHPYYASDRETMAERDKLLRNYSKLEYFRVNQLVPFVNRVSEKISEMYDIYNNNLYYLEAMDDYYRERLDEVYSEHTSLSDKIENFVEKALDVALAFVLPIVIVGVMAAICILCPPAGLIVKNAMVIGCASLVVMPDSIMPEALKEIRDDTIGRAVMLVTEGPKAVIEDIGQDFMDGIQTPEGIAGYAGDAVVSFAGLWYLKYRKVTGAKIGEVDDLARAGDVDDVAPGVKNKKADVGKVNTESGNTSRPTWRQSELDAASDFPDYDAQKSFINGKEVPYGTKGSVRPDYYKDGYSVDIKNYNVESASGRSNLARNIEKQYYQRIQNLPAGTKQSVMIDIRGQNISDADISALYDDIMRRTNNGVEILFKMD